MMYHKDGSLPPPGNEWIWVFGSNLAGRHGMGAALVAKRAYGALYGCANGPMGLSYAIPTKGFHLDTLSLEHIQRYVREFKRYAAITDQQFFVTSVGCGLAGYKPADIAPMFAHSPMNCSFPDTWRDILEEIGT